MTTKLFLDITDVCAEEICGTEDTVSASGDDLLELEELPSFPATRSRASSQESAEDVNLKTNIITRRRSARSRESSQEGSGEDVIEGRATRGRTSSREESGEEIGGVPSIRGRADSGALLDMLAEVASQKLLFSPTKRRSERNSSENGIERLSLSQVRGLSTNQLIKIFSTTEFDEMKRLYSFYCTFDHTCSAKYVSFGNENRAKEKFKKHLFQHLEQLKLNDEVLKGGARRGKRGGVARRGRGRSKEHTEEEVPAKVEVMEEVKHWSEPFILESLDSANMKPKQAGFLFEEKGPKVEVEMVSEEAAPVDLKAVAETSAALDLNRLIAGLSEKMGVCGVVGEHSYSTAEQPKEDEEGREEPDEEDESEKMLEVKVVHSSEELRNFMDIETKDTVMVCVVEGNNMVLKHLPQVGQQVDIESSTIVAAESALGVSCDILRQDLTDYNVIRSNELPIIADNRTDSPPPDTAYLDPSALWELNHGVHIERDEFHQARKPKGKAKFIGQSKLEKELALEAIEAIRKKTGGGGLDTLQCTICQPARCFTAPTTLISHYRSHAGIKPYECRVCNAVFTRQHSLNYHMLIHTNQTRFTCQDCGRKFRHPSHFKEHRRRHTGESPFECSDCLIRFKTRNTYKRHLRTRHGKVLTTSGGLIILSEDEFQMVRTVPRHNVVPTVKRGRPRKTTSPDALTSYEDYSIDVVDEDIQALHQLEIVTSNENNFDYEKDVSMDIEAGDEMPVDFIKDETEDGANASTNAAYEEIVKEAVRLEKAEKEKKLLQQQVKSIGGSSEQSDEETIVIETEDHLSRTGLYLATLEDGQTVLVNTDENSQQVNLGFKVVQVGGKNKYLIANELNQEPTVIVIKNEPVD